MLYMLLLKLILAKNWRLYRLVKCLLQSVSRLQENEMSYLWQV